MKGVMHTILHDVFYISYSLESSIADVDVCAHNVIDFGAKIVIIWRTRLVEDKIQGQ